MIKEWWHAPALWWQFWLPQSGGPGGLISAMIICALVILLGL